MHILFLSAVLCARNTPSVLLLFPRITFLGAPFNILRASMRRVESPVKLKTTFLILRQEKSFSSEGKQQICGGFHPLSYLAGRAQRRAGAGKRTRWDSSRL